MDEFNIDKHTPDNPWIGFRNTLIGLVAGVITLALLFKFC